MAKAVEMIEHELATTNDVPVSVLLAMAQGPEEAVARYTNKMQNVGLVCALFIVGAIGAVMSPPDMMLELDDDDWRFVAFYVFMHISCLCFFMNIVFFVHMMNWFPKLLHRDADIFIFFLSTQFDTQIELWCIQMTIIGLTSFFIGVYVVVCILFPVHIVMPVFCITFVVPAFALFLVHPRLGACRPVWATLARDVDANRAKHAAVLLDKIYRPRAEYDRSNAAGASASGGGTEMHPHITLQGQGSGPMV